MGIMQKYGKKMTGIMQYSSPGKETLHVQAENISANARMEGNITRTVGSFKGRLVKKTCRAAGQVFFRMGWFCMDRVF